MQWHALHCTWHNYRIIYFIIWMGKQNVCFQSNILWTYRFDIALDYMVSDDCSFAGNTTSNMAIHMSPIFPDQTTPKPSCDKPVPPTILSPQPQPLILFSLWRAVAFGSLVGPAVHLNLPDSISYLLIFSIGCAAMGSAQHMKAPKRHRPCGLALGATRPRGAKRFCLAGFWFQGCIDGSTGKRQGMDEDEGADEEP